MSESHRLSYIQGLRGVSVLLIFLFHADFFFRGGFVGVDMFFVISGFVMTRMLLRENISNEVGINWKKFFYNRARRPIPFLSIFVDDSAESIQYSWKPNIKPFSYFCV